MENASYQIVREERESYWIHLRSSRSPTAQNAGRILLGSRWNDRMRYRKKLVQYGFNIRALPTWLYVLKQFLEFSHTS